MGWKGVLFAVVSLLVVALLIFYWVLPIGSTDFGFFSPKNSNFTLDSTGTGNMQFYENMRFPTPDISYRIERCPLGKKDEMERAFGIMEQETSLSFYPVSFDEEISITCEAKTESEGGLFIAGEGGPTNISITDNFNVIRTGSILLIRESKCENPNVATHELLHVLGFNHSENSNNIMYPVTKCSQTIGQDTLDLINLLYSYSSLPDLSFANITASMSGRYLDMNMTVRNNGLADASGGKVKIYADTQLIKEIDLKPLKIGYGRIISFNNLFVLQTRVNELRFVIDTNFAELEKENNEAILKTS